ncbi:hypothetical protein [Paracraurococcus lichenis]|uniref:Heme exporter protein D n=1 Tax=Paracraurococcus lichenis TaxID=3064888 RepID=A0ABT9E0L8_9PROT|nr:hypothetical protein [Paracraurococcus sp. LOR1-02]MDO9709705.1 hypothetical protein [Paracraurococcus sp. LOR1-02]
MNDFAWIALGAQALFLAMGYGLFLSHRRRLRSEARRRAQGGGGLRS